MAWGWWIITTGLLYDRWRIYRATAGGTIVDIISRLDRRPWFGPDRQSRKGVKPEQRTC
jgi:hypothetical protein